MKSISEKIYFHIPVFLQNFFVLLKGYSLEKIRHSGQYYEFMEQIKARNRWPADHFRSFQEIQLKELIKHAYQNIPYYSELYKERGVSPADIRSVADIKKLPMVTKEDLRRNWKQFIDKRFSDKKLLTVHTTGTTGTPLKIFTDKTERQWNYAFFDAYQKSLGIDITGKRATFGGRIIIPPDQRKPPFWRYSYSQKNLLFSSYHLMFENLPYYIDKLNEYQPEVIDAYPSSIFNVAKYARERNIRLISPKAIITSAETLFDEQREIIERAFQCKVFDQYGAAEMCVFVGQCESGKYHIRPDYGIIEFIKDGRSANAGELAEIICTSFINWKMPLIRYRIGDLAIPTYDSCDCGLNTPIIESIQGRIDDTIVTRSGAPVGRLSPVLKGFPVLEALYIQEVIGELILQVVKGEGYSDNDSNAIIAEIKKRVGNDMDIKLEFVNQIEREYGSKNKAVISKLRNRTQFCSKEIGL